MGTFNDGDSGSSIRTKINTAIQKTEGSSAISTIDVDGGAIDGVTLGTNSAVTEAQVDNININGNTISSTDTNGDVTIDPNGTGDVNIGNFKFDADQSVGAGQDNYVLTYDNSGGKISLEAASGGGGGADLYTANESSATANTVTGANAVAIGSGNTASAESSLSFGVNATASGLGAFAVGRNTTAGSGADSFAFGSAAVASGGNSLSIGSNTDATNNSSIAIGNSAQSVGAYSVALAKSYASGADSLAAAIGTNSSSYGATGANSISMGYQSKASQQNAAAFGSYAVASGLGSLALSTEISGADCTASGEQAVVLGQGVIAEASRSYAFGNEAKSQVVGKYTYASGKFAAAGDAQGGQFILRADTTDATATVLTTNNTAAGNNDQIVANNDTCITFDGTITAMQNGAQAYASWRIEGLLVNDGGTTTLANSATTVISNGSSWGMALSADNTNNALAITCTGEASHNIRWVANIRTTEVTYA